MELNTTLSNLQVMTIASGREKQKQVLVSQEIQEAQELPHGESIMQPPFHGSLAAVIQHILTAMDSVEQLAP